MRSYFYESSCPSQGELLLQSTGRPFAESLFEAKVNIEVIQLQQPLTFNACQVLNALKVNMK